MEVVKLSEALSVMGACVADMHAKGNLSLSTVTNLQRVVTGINYGMARNSVDIDLNSLGLEANHEIRNALQSLLTQAQSAKEYK